MKYGELSLGQVKAIVNKLGGIDGVKRFLSGEIAVAKNNVFKNDKAKDGWKLLEDVPFDGKQFVPESAVNLNVHFGQHHAEYLLEHQDWIPKELRGKYLVFPGTVWLNGDDGRFVSYLYWFGDKWYLDFSWLMFGWDGYDQLVCFRD